MTSSEGRRSGRTESLEDEEGVLPWPVCSGAFEGPTRSEPCYNQITLVLCEVSESQGATVKGKSRDLSTTQGFSALDIKILVTSSSPNFSTKKTLLLSWFLLIQRVSPLVQATWKLRADAYLQGKLFNLSSGIQSLSLSLYFFFFFCHSMPHTELPCPPGDGTHDPWIESMES